MDLTVRDRVAGVDGCSSGWLCISQDLEGGTIGSAIFGDAAALVGQTPAPVMMAIDVPIGLVERGERDCDRLARSLLARRACCVFSAPTREVLLAGSHAEASELRRRAEGKGVAAQAWSLFDRVREIDAALTPQRQAWLREVHPELCFMQWNDGEPLVHGKRTPTGRLLRQALVRGTFGAEAFDQVRRRHSRSAVRDDDILDAFAALRTARRICDGSASRLPDAPALDAASLRMEMWM